MKHKRRPNYRPSQRPLFRRAPPSIDEQLVRFVHALPFVSAYAYGCAYLRDCGERSVTGLPSAFVEFTWTDALTTVLRGGLVAIGLSAIFAATNYAETQPSFARRWMAVSAAFLFFCFCMSASYDRVHWTFTSVFIALVASAIAGWRLASLATSRKGFDRVSLVSGMAGALLAASGFFGMWDAANREQYPVIPEQPGALPQVVLRMVQDRAVVAPLHRWSGTYDAAFKLIDMKGVAVRYEQLGPLRRSPTLSACATDGPSESAVTGPSSVAGTPPIVATSGDDICEEPMLCEEATSESAPP